MLTGSRRSVPFLPAAKSSTPKQPTGLTFPFALSPPNPTYTSSPRPQTMSNFELAGRTLRVAWAQDQSKPALSVLPPGLTAAGAAAQAAAQAAKAAASAAGGVAAAQAAARLTAASRLQGFGNGGAAGAVGGVGVGSNGGGVWVSGGVGQSGWGGGLSAVQQQAQVQAQAQAAAAAVAMATQQAAGAGRASRSRCMCLVVS